MFLQLYTKFASNTCRGGGTDLHSLMFYYQHNYRTGVPILTMLKHKCASNVPILPMPITYFPRDYMQPQPTCTDN